MKRSRNLKYFGRIAVLVLAVWPPLTLVFAQDEPPGAGNAASQSMGPPESPAVAPRPSLAGEAVIRRFRLEASGFDNMVSNGFGNWRGGGLSLSWTPSGRVALFGTILSQSRPGETEQLSELRTVVNWSKWFYTDMAVSGGGPEDPAAFFPRFRYDVAANLKVPLLPGLIFTGGLTRLYFGAPNNLRIRRGGVIYYWRRFVFQSNAYFNNARPGNRKSTSANGAVQYGQEGHYWVGLGAGGGRQAWQTLTLTPQAVEFTGTNASVFLRKWLAPSYGVAFSYNYTLIRTAYRINGLEMKFFLDF